MDFFQLQYESRTPDGRRVRALRASGKVPAVVYGHGFPNQTVAIDHRDLERFLHRAHVSPIVHLSNAAGSPIPAVLKELVRDPMTERIEHADFHRVRMEERLTSTCAIELTGESPAVKEHGGILVKLLPQLDIECLPGDLVSSISVDLSALRNINDRIRVADLVAPKGIRVLNDPETIVCVVQEQRAEEVEQAKPVEDVSQVADVVSKEKKEPESEQTPQE